MRSENQMRDGKGALHRFAAFDLWAVQPLDLHWTANQRQDVLVGIQEVREPPDSDHRLPEQPVVSEQSVYDLFQDVWKPCVESNEVLILVFSRKRVKRWIRHKISVNGREFEETAANETKRGHCSPEVFGVKRVLLLWQVGPIDAETSIVAFEVSIEDSCEIHFGIQNEGNC